MKQTKVAIFGAGSVGATAAYALMWKGATAQIMLIDIDEKRCRGEVLDLSDALPFCCSSEILQATPQDAAQADIIIIAAGTRQKHGQKRSELITANKKIVYSIITQMQPINPDAIIIMVTNPVDVLAYYAQQISKLPKKQVFGTGTYLDSQRLRNLLAQKLRIAEQSIEAYVLGEHGESQFVAWSCMSLAGIPLLEFPYFSPEELSNIAEKTRNKAYEIINCKNATYFGIAACIADICECITFNQKRVIPISCFNETFDVNLSMPCILANNGIQQQIPIRLNKKEQNELEASANKVKKMINEL